MQVATLTSTWLTPDDWDIDEDTNEYIVGSTEHFIIKCSFERDGIFFDFKDPVLQAIQLDEFQSRIIVNVEHDRFNRIHINGISPSNQNKGLGKEIYRALIDGFGMISTCLVYHSCSEGAQRVWKSLLGSGEYLFFQNGDHLALATDHTKLDRFINRFK